MRVGFYDHPVFREHAAGPLHPERPERLDAVRRGLESAGLLNLLALQDPRDATPDELRRIHTDDHVARVAASQGRSVRFDADTAAGPLSYPAALKAAGATVDAVERVLDGGLNSAFCSVRPPGHHAEGDRAMGFCLFNNIAVAAAAALARGLPRVAIVDFDVHHGNGTQHSFESDPRVLYLSAHQYPLYPGTGSIAEVGRGEGTGYTINLPLPAGMGPAEYGSVFEEVVLPIGQSFDPELVLVSAGFDADARDPLAGMNMTPNGFGGVMDVCLRIAEGAAQGRLVVVLEGGYDLDAIASGAEAVARSLLGHRQETTEARSEHGRLLSRVFRQAYARYWPVLG